MKSIKYVILTAHALEIILNKDPIATITRIDEYSPLSSIAL